jgi:phosphate uptake regulator
MEYRKLISFGKSSYVVSLPKAWVRHNKLEKGDLIYFNEENDKLTLGISDVNKEEQRSRIISVDGKSILHLQRELNAAYIENCREISFTGTELKEKSEDLLSLIKELIALEVLEITAKKIVTKDFLSMDKVSIAELVKKVDMIVRSMLQDCSTCFDEKNAKNISLRDNDVNRISFLLFRIIRYGFRNQSRMMKNFSLEAGDLLNYYWTTYQLESIADEAKRISRGMEAIKLPEAKQKSFLSHLKDMEDLYLAIMKSYYQKDLDKAFQLSNRKKDLIKSINVFFEDCRGIEGITYLTDRYRKCVGSIHEFARLIYQK